MHIKFYISTIILLIIFSCTNRKQKDERFSNIIDIKDFPTQKSKTTGLFSDQGAWFGFCLLPDSCNVTGFGGPWLISEKKWASQSLTQFGVRLNGNDVTFKKTSQSYLPGMIEANFYSDVLSLKLSLFYGDNGVSYEIATITNKSNKNQKVYLSWYGKSWGKIDENDEKYLSVLYRNDRKLNVIQDFTNTKLYVDTTSSDYRFEAINPVILKSNEETKSFIAIGLAFTDKEKIDIYNQTSKTIDKVISQYNASRTRWKAYLNAILLTKETDYDKIAVKSLMTLMSNWRKAEFDLKHDGVIPSHAVTYFDGFWAWDSWKHATALSLFKPDLAKSQILAMFDYQDSSGMIPDCIFLNKSDNNNRNTKPPLAAWAVYETFINSHDTNFVKELLPKLTTYHKWWYTHRDVNKNGWCEFGSTDGTLEAAAWESGMDNAVRFDSTKMLRTNDNAWSMDQESVDLNAFLSIEKYYLSELYKAIGNLAESKKYLSQYNDLKNRFDSYFFDCETGYYFDVSIKNGKKIMVEGTEAFVPTWAKLTRPENCLKIKDIVINRSKFNTYVPLPTLSADNAKFNTNGYWRGSVWIDQVWFGISGLANYNFTQESKDLTLKLFNNANGLMKDKPIYENYNPLTGEREEAPHFSWSAAHLLLLYRMENDL